MCRWLAYLGEPIPMDWLTTGPAQPQRLEKKGQWLFVDEFINP